MKVIDIYLQYFAAECEFAGTLRKGAAAQSLGGVIHWDAPRIEARYA